MVVWEWVSLEWMGTCISKKGTLYDGENVGHDVHVALESYRI